MTNFISMSIKLRYRFTMRYYKDDGKMNIEGQKPEEISLQVALQEVDKIPSEDVYGGNFIGFTGEKGKSIQFIRKEQDSWMIDVPVLENGKFAYSLQDMDLTTEKVKDIVKKFYLGENWESLCNLTKKDH